MEADHSSHKLPAVDHTQTAAVCSQTDHIQLAAEHILSVTEATECNLAAADHSYYNCWTAFRNLLLADRSNQPEYHNYQRNSCHPMKTLIGCQLSVNLAVAVAVRGYSHWMDLKRTQILNNDARVNTIHTAQ